MFLYNDLFFMSLDVFAPQPHFMSLDVQGKETRTEQLWVVMPFDVLHSNCR